MRYKYGIGLELHNNAIGWSVVGLDQNERPCGIIDMGTRAFTAAENPQNGKSLTVERREARSARRRTQRRRHRKQRIKNLIVREKILTQEEMSTLFDGVLEDIYAIRVRALDEKVTAEEFARILLHISQRRGFRSNRKSASDKKDGELLKCVHLNESRMAEKGYRTVGEMFFKDEAFNASKRNRDIDYNNVVSRAMVEDEVKQIFDAQRKFGAAFASQNIESEYLEILLSQRSFDEGPGGNSPYAGNPYERTTGYCTLEKTERRAAKATYSFEYFNLLQKLNHIRIIDSNGQTSALTQEQRNSLVELAHKTKKVTYARIRKQLNLTDKQLFNIEYKEGVERDKVEDQKAADMPAFHEMRLAFNKKLGKGYIDTMPTEKRNAIGTALTAFHTDAKIKEYLQEAGLTPEEIDAASTVKSFSKNGHLSVKACNNLIPFLEQGMTYNAACDAAGYNFQGDPMARNRKQYLHFDKNDMGEITSPVVLRTISQSFKVINAIIRKQESSPMFLNLELTRELKSTFLERQDIKGKTKKRMAENKKLEDELRTECGLEDPTGLDIIKLKLWKEQEGRSAYSRKQISIEELFDDNVTAIDYILPVSISYDTGYNNRVLCLKSEKIAKAGRLPLQYLDPAQHDKYAEWVNATIKNSAKKRNLLQKELTENDLNKYWQRNVMDNYYIAKFLVEYFTNHLDFAPTDKKSIQYHRVAAYNSVWETYLRKRWGYNQIQKEGDLDHALRALGVACTTYPLIKLISRYEAWNERQFVETEDDIAVDEDTGEILKTFPYPWPCFRKETEARMGSNPRQAVISQRFPIYMDGEFAVKPLFTSRAPSRRITGSAHQDKIRGRVEGEPDLTVIRRPLTELKLDASGEIKDYYNPDGDRILYEALRDRLVQFGGDAAKAFEEPFYKPKSNLIVRGVRLTTKSNLKVNIPGSNGLALNETMVRADIFYVPDEGYYLVPIYVADTIKKELPNKACLAHKPYAEWKEMRDANFLFSLYPNDLIRITHRKKLKLKPTQKGSKLPEYETTSELLYYICSDISSAAISGITHDGNYEIAGCGIKKLDKLEKYTVDILGEYHKVSTETRMPFKC